MPSTARLLARSRRVAAIALACVALACAGAGHPGGSPGAGATAGKPGTAAGKAAPAAARFTPDLPAAASYGPDPRRKCTRTPIQKEVEDQLEQAAKKAQRPAPMQDGRVCAVAESFLGWDSAALGPPRPEVLEFVSQWFGLPATVLPPSFATFESEDAALIAERIVQATAGAVLNAVYPRLAVASKRVGRGQTKVAVVLLDAPIELEALPRRLELNQGATVAGQLRGGSKNPQVLVSDTTGKLSKPAQAPGEAFKAELKCGDRPGKIVVEVRGEYEGKTGIAGRFPVSCGGELPTSVAVAPEPWPTEPAAAERRILEAINAERAAAGLGALTWDDGAANVARGISQEIAESGEAKGDVAERLKKEGIASSLVLQTAASDRSFERAQERLASSPVNREYILNPQVTHVGVGGFTRAGPDGKPLVYVTEVYLKELAPADVTKTRQDLRAAVAQKRRDSRMNPLRDEPFLDEAAQKYADALAAAGGDLPKEKQAELTAPLTKTMRTLTILSGAKPDPLDFAEEPQVTAVAKAVGVGVAQGRHPVLGRNATYVVIMVGTTRADAGEKPVKGPGKASKRATKPAK